MTGTAWVVYYSMAKRKMANEATLPSTVFLPAVGTTTNAVVGAVIVRYSYNISARLGVPVIIVGYMLVGFGGWLAMLVYAVFLYSFFTNGLPPPAKLPGMMMLVGPAGQTCAALQLLGAASRMDFGGYNKGTFLTMSGAESLASASEMLGLMFLGFDVFWAVFCVYALVDYGFRGKLVPAMTVSSPSTKSAQSISILTRNSVVVYHLPSRYNEHFIPCSEHLNGQSDLPNTDYRSILDLTDRLLLLLGNDVLAGVEREDLGRKKRGREGVKERLINVENISICRKSY